MASTPTTQRDAAAGRDDRNQTTLTAADAAVVPGAGAAVLTTNDKDVIDNIRTRVNQIETALQRLGLIG